MTVQTIELLGYLGESWKSFNTIFFHIYSFLFERSHTPDMSPCHWPQFLISSGGCLRCRYFDLALLCATFCWDNKTTSEYSERHPHYIVYFVLPIYMYTASPCFSNATINLNDFLSFLNYFKKMSEGCFFSIISKSIVNTLKYFFTYHVILIRVKIKYLNQNKDYNWFW